MNNPRSASKTLLMVSLLFFIVSLFLLLITDFSTDLQVDRSGGAFGISPDGRWYAEIWDGHCDDNGKYYATISLWDLKKYPSKAQPILIRLRQKPEVKLVFPKTFAARASSCGVKWVSNDVFEIELVSDGSDQIFRYNIAKHVFFLRERDTTTEQDAPADA